MQANAEYFKQFLNFSASKFCSDYLENIDYNLRGYFDNELFGNPDITLENIMNKKTNTRKLIKEDYFILALNSILESSL